MNGPELFTPTVPQAVAIDNYKTAAKETLSAANSVADKIVTAAFSIATAFGAVIALVAPEETPSPVVIGIPFALLTLAVGTALYAQSIGVDLVEDDALDKMQKAVNDAVTSKRWWGRVALVSLAMGILAAGILVHDVYAEPSEPESPVSVRVWLTDTGVKSLARACGGEGRVSIKGKVKAIEDLEKRSIPIEVTKKACASGAGTLVLRRMQIVAAKQ